MFCLYFIVKLISADRFVETASQAADAGVKVVSIMDGRVRHCVLKALSGEVFGTRVIRG